MAGLIKEKGPNLNQEDIAQITSMLREIARKESILAKGKAMIRMHVNAYKALHKKDIAELEKRRSQATDPKKQKIIDEELTVPETDDRRG